MMLGTPPVAQEYAPGYRTPPRLTVSYTQERCCIGAAVLLLLCCCSIFDFVRGVFASYERVYLVFTSVCIYDVRPRECRYR